MENRKSSIRSIIAFAVCIGMVGSFAMAGFVPIMPQAFAEPSVQSNVAYNGPHVPQVSFHLQNGIPLGPPYGTPTLWHEEQTIAVVASIGALVFVVALVIYLTSGKNLPVMKIR